MRQKRSMVSISLSVGAKEEHRVRLLRMRKRAPMRSSRLTKMQSVTKIAH
jgi:hypothetical protein